MARSRLKRAFPTGSGLLLLLALPLQAATRDFCKVCHSEVEVQFRDSVHYKEEMSCTDCHGGDPSILDIEKAHGRDFREAPSREQIPALCASCHADPERMRPYGIATDQHVLYLTSGHGRAFSRGDTRVAICTDCHGTHRLLPSEAPDSPASRLNISATCNHCHGDGALMAPYGLRTDIVERYEASVHASALRLRGNWQAPDCTGCHGSHGAAPPGVGSISRACGQCHAKTWDFFRQSPHYSRMPGGDQQNCTSCHESHETASPDRGMWVSFCADCHDAASTAARTGEKILALATQAEEEMEKARQAIVQVREIPLDVTDYETRLDNASTYLIEVGPLSHALDVEDVEDLTRKARSIAQEVQGELHEKILVFEGRKFIVIFVWIYILITIVAIQYYKRAAR
jgi:hypothetical protein